MSVSFKAKRIKEGILKEIWNRKFSDKPFPKVKAFKMPNKRYLETLKKMRQSSKKKTEAQDLKEYGKILCPDEVEQLAGYSGLDRKSGNFFIIVNEDSVHPSMCTLAHELEHIYKGDLSE
jgi:hypothetical protein